MPKTETDSDDDTVASGHDDNHSVLGNADDQSQESDDQNDDEKVALQGRSKRRRLAPLQNELVGRRVRINATDLGDRWAVWAFGAERARTAFLVALVIEFDDTPGHHAPVIVEFPSDGHTMRMTESEAIKCLIPPDMESEVVGTPFLKNK